MSNKVRPIVWLVVMVLSVLGMINVYGDNEMVQSSAQESACPGCKATMTRLERTPFAQTFRFQLATSEEVIVSCTREAIFFGDYACEKQ